MASKNTNYISAVCQQRKLLVTLALIIRKRQHQKLQSKRRIWVRPWISRRLQYGAYEVLMKELMAEDRPGYASIQRAHPDLFQEILDKVEPIIRRQDTHFRLSIPPAVRLAITLRFLATGNTYMSQSYLFRVAPCTISKIVPEVCEAIYEVLQPDYMKCPQTNEQWEAIANDFQERWQFQNCLGALDGKHITIRPPAKSGSNFFNYKHSFSLVLLALVDAKYKFIFVSVGTNGRVADGGVFASSQLNKALQEHSLNIPDQRPLPRDDKPLPLTIVADDAFPLRDDIMKPYPFRNLDDTQRIFNYRLSRARRVVENAFGILSNRFRVLLSAMLLKPERIEKVVLATCVLHNLLRDRSPNSTAGILEQEDPDTHEFHKESWRQDANMQQIHLMQCRNATTRAKAQRDYLRGYFNSEAGSVPWQYQLIHRM